MDWDKLKIFHAVAETGSFTNAGKSLNLSQSVVSRHMGALEEKLGVGLFRRHARGLVLTEQGEILHGATQDIYKKLSIIKGRLIDTRDLPEGPLTITVSDFIGLTWLAPRLGEFKTLHPDIQLTVLFEDRILNINLKEADGTIRLSRAKEPGLIQRKLGTIHFHICGTRDYFKKNGHPKDIDDLKNHCLIAFPENLYSPFPKPNWLFDIAGIKPREGDNNILMVNSMYAINKAVRAGAGIAVLPDYLIEEHNLETTLPELKRPPVDIYFIYAEERKNSKRIGIFRDFVLENIKNTNFQIKVS